MNILQDIFKWVQSIITQGFIIYLITIAVSFKVWDIYVEYTQDKYNYECKKQILFKSATPDSYVFIKTSSECFDIRDKLSMKKNTKELKNE